MKCLLDVAGCDATGQSTEIPFKVLDVRFNLNGWVGNDGGIIELGGAARGTWISVMPILAKSCLALAEEGEQFFTTVMSTGE